MSLGDQQWPEMLSCPSTSPSSPPAAPPADSVSPRATSTLTSRTKSLLKSIQPLDPILLSAVIEGSAPLNTRNHFGHEFHRESFVSLSLRFGSAHAIFPPVGRRWRGGSWGRSAGQIRKTCIKLTVAFNVDMYLHIHRLAASASTSSWRVRWV